MISRRVRRVAETWIVNSSPLIILHRIGNLNLLPRLGAQVAIPGGVLDEIGRGPAPIAGEILGAFREVAVQSIDTIVAGWDLGRGESEVLTWASATRSAVAILDDLAARRCATSLGIQTHGTLFVLVEAKRAGLIPAVAPLIDRARSTGFFLSDVIVRNVLRAAGEGA